MRAKLLTFALNFCHFDLKVSCCPGVTGFCAVPLEAKLGFFNDMYKYISYLRKMPWSAAYHSFHFEDSTLKLTVDERVLLVEDEIHFIFKVAVSSLRCNAPDVIGGHHL